MGAICKVGENWFGLLYSWADSKKKSNLMLSIFEPGNLISNDKTNKSYDYNELFKEPNVYHGWVI